MGVCSSKPNEIIATNVPAQVANPTQSYQRASITLRVDDITIYDNIYKYYQLDKVLGDGTFGIVRECTRINKKSSKKKYAVKTIKKAGQTNIADLKIELSNLIALDHPNIIKFYEVYEDKQYVHIIFEKCNGGDLFDRIITNDGFSEHEAQPIFNSIVGAINHMHTLNIAHRDIKPENLLFMEDDSDDLKIIDLGLSSVYGRGQMNTLVGSPYYVAPEVIKGQYGKECDVWSLGVLLYCMLSAYPPFYGESRKEIFKQIRKGEYEFHDEVWDNKSSAAKDLIRNMLVVDP